VRIRLAVPDSAVKPDVLDAALEAVTRTDEHLLDQGSVPTAEQAIVRGVRWQPEPPGDEHFDTAETVLARGHGDCDDLAPWHAASLRHTGTDPGAKAVVTPTGPNRWHAVVQRSNGTIEDPSAEAGMHEYSRVSGISPQEMARHIRLSTQPPLQPHGRPHVATRRVLTRGGPVWCVRVDVPWKGSRYAISCHAIRRKLNHAVRDSIRGACVVGEASDTISREHAMKLEALEALLHGHDPKHVKAALLAAGVSPHVVGSLFSGLLKTAVSLAPIPGAGLISNLIPEGGGGGPGRSAPPAQAGPAPAYGSPLGPQPSHGGGRMRTRAYGGTAHGPIIVRF